MSRRELSALDRFDEVSPEVGELDEAALVESLAEDADETLALLSQMTRATDAALRAQARRLASELFLELARDTPPDAAGVGRRIRMPYRPDRGDLDLDGSLDAIVEAQASAAAVRVEDLVVDAWARPSTAWCLLVDRSGSMHGRPLATSALAAAAVATRADGDYAVLSFAKDVVAAKAMWEARRADDVVDRVLALTGHGTTDVAGALRAAGAQLRVSGAARRVTVLLSDCRATVPGDVVAAARALDELVVLAPEGDSEEAEALVTACDGRWTAVEGPSTIVAAVMRVLAR